MDYWQKQEINKPLFEDILWSRPETKRGAGKLLIVGGNSFGFASVGQAYHEANKAGAGQIHSLLPISLKPTVGGLLENTSFAASTPSGSFSTESLNELLINSGWADMVLLAGDFGKNSETSVLLEKYLHKFSGPIVVSKDAVNYLYTQPNNVIDRDNTILILNLSQLQRLGIASKFETPFLLSMGVMLLVQALHDFTRKHKVMIVTKELDNVIIAKDGIVSSTKLTNDKELWQVETSAKVSVFCMQNPNKPFEAATTALVI